MTNMPSNVSAVPKPQTISGPPYTYSVIFTTAAPPSSTPGYYTYTVISKFIPTGSNNPETSGYTAMNYIGCSVHAKQCPNAEIVDNLQAVKPVVVSSGSPPPAQSVVAGRKMDLATRWQVGTGTGTYAVSTTYSPYPTKWTISGGADAVESYDISTGSAPVPVPATLTTIEPTFYWIRGSDQVNGDTQTVDTVLERSDKQEYAYPENYARYIIQAPTTTSYIHQIYPIALVGGQSDQQVGLGLGSSPSLGMTFGVTASIPKNGAGYLAAQQLIANNLTWTPTDPAQPTGTNFVTELDSCVLYSNATAVKASTSGTWQSYDVPKTELPSEGLGIPLETTRQDYFNTFMLYLPQPLKAPVARPSIWVPLGQVSWQWSYDVTRTSKTALWTPAQPLTSYYDTGEADSDVFPIWNNLTYGGPAPNDPCPPVPPSN
jgi:hypothetical protein